MLRRSRQEWAWAFYDFGNSAYALLVMTLFYPLFFAQWVADSPSGATLWGVAVATSIAIAAVLAPLIGAFTDRNGKRKSYLVLFSTIAITATAALGTSARFGWLTAMIVFVVANSSFAVAHSLYDSFVGVITPKSGSATVLSGLGWAVGYVGGPLCLGFAWLMLGGRLPVSFEDYELVFMVTAAFFLVASFWSFRALPTDRKDLPRDDGNSLRAAWTTIRNWREQPQIFTFLAAMYCLMDGLTTMVYFVSLFASEVLSFSIGQIVGLLVLVQVIGIFTTAGMALLADRVGEVRVLILMSFVWIAIAVLIFLAESFQSFVVVALLTGLVIGSTPAIGRGYLAKLIPAERRAELFGFNTLAGRIATLIGPLLFGIAAGIWDMRIAVLTSIPFFVMGAFILMYYSHRFAEHSNAGS